MGPPFLMGFLWSAKFPLGFLTVTPEQSRESSVSGTNAARTRRRPSALAQARARARPPAPAAPRLRSGSPGVTSAWLPRMSDGRQPGRGSVVVAWGVPSPGCGSSFLCLHSLPLLPLATWVLQAPSKALVPESGGQGRAHCSAVCSASQACQEGRDPASLRLLGRHPVVSTEGPHRDSG